MIPKHMPAGSDTVALPGWLRVVIRQYAMESGRTRNEIMRTAILDYLEKVGKIKKGE